MRMSKWAIKEQMEPETNAIYMFCVCLARSWAAYRRPACAHPQRKHPAGCSIAPNTPTPAVDRVAPLDLSLEGTNLHNARRPHHARVRKAQSSTTTPLRIPFRSRVVGSSSQLVIFMVELRRERRNLPQLLTVVRLGMPISASRHEWLLLNLINGANTRMPAEPQKAWTAAPCARPASRLHARRDCRENGWPSECASL